ncbi:MAG: electron transport complex subunit RsxC [Candidatus Omnitrophica bacterium]|nr:electron transport complex subunit RsxC [Candidatus Omnitrophota bacterium]
MLALEEHKHHTEHKPIERLPVPVKVYLPLSQHLGKPCLSLVKVGEIVREGQKIADAQAHVSSPIHSSINGVVCAIQDWPHPVLGRSKAIVIEHKRDGEGAKVIEARSQEEVNLLTVEAIRQIVSEAGIVGMGGASFPTFIKLTPPKPVDTLIINGAECEPYLTADYRLMIEKTKEVMQGIDLAKKCLGVTQVVIAIEDNKPEAIRIFRELIGDSGYGVRVLKSSYPQGGEKQLVKNLLGKEVPSGKLPFAVGVVVHNVATICAIYEAVYCRKPLYERVVTVTGSCITEPKNLLVPLGTPLKALLEYCGPFSSEPAKVITGGPMMGIAQYSLDAPVIKSTNGIICFSEDQVRTSEAATCIRCGRCVEQCPVGLMPCLINLASSKEKWDLSKTYGAMECMECGLCNYTCPQKINLVQNIKQAKERCKK